MPATSSFVAAFTLGLLSTLHCWGMCGGIITALSMGLPANVRDRPSRLMLFASAFNLGRVGSYTLAGLVAGAAGSLVTVAGPSTGLVALQWFAGLVLIFVGLRLAGWMASVAVLERAGQLIWRQLQPVGRAFIPPDHVHKALLMGMIWGGLPCGLVYSALLFALASGSGLTGAGLMLTFGLGTLPGMISAGFVGGRFQTWLHKPHLRQAAGIIIIALGIAVPLLHSPFFHDYAGQHIHQSHPQ